MLGRIIWAAALVAGIAYFAITRMDGDGTAGEPAIIALKGAGVALLACWVALRATGRDGWLLVLFLALCALGDVLIDAVSVLAGGGAFFAAHMVAIALYQFNRRAMLSRSQRLLALAITPASLLIGWACVGSRPDVLFALLYIGAVALMATMAWISRFPRYRTGIGALLFLVSDLLIFAQMGPLAGSLLPVLSIWPLYFAGQVLIAWGVIATLQSDQAAG